jgi:hypothetical protein
MLVGFRKTGIPWISRKGAYSRPEEKISVGAFRKIEYHFGGVI